MLGALFSSEVLSWWVTAVDYFSPAEVYPRAAPSCLCLSLPLCLMWAQREDECMPGSMLPPHQTCPLPRLSLCLPFTVIRTQRESSSCCFFSSNRLSPRRRPLRSLWTPWCKIYNFIFAAVYRTCVLVRDHYEGYITRSWGAKGDSVTKMWLVSSV